MQEVSSSVAKWLWASALLIGGTGLAQAAVPTLDSLAAQSRTQVSPRDDAPIDLTGTWVAIVNEDWRWRMVTPPKGDYASVPLNPRGRQVADTWDASQEGSCKAFGAAGIMRLPLRMRISWEGDNVLKLETDAGQQTRRFVFAPDGPLGQPGPSPKPADVAPSLQGFSEARWIHTLVPPGIMGFNFGPPPPAPPGGALTVTTTSLQGGWLRRNGVPFSANAIVKEYYDRFTAPNGDEWLVVTTEVTDPQFLFEPFVTSSHFRRELNDGKWDPTPCK